MAAAAAVCAALALPGGSAEAVLSGTPTFEQPVALMVWRIHGQTKLCTGTLISTDWVLTAQHCLSDGQGQLKGSTDTLSITVGGLRRGVDHVVLRSGWQPFPTMPDDLALIELDQPVLDVTPVPVLLGPSASRIRTHVGWGDDGTYASGGTYVQRGAVCGVVAAETLDRYNPGTSRPEDVHPVRGRTADPGRQRRARDRPAA